MDRANCDDVHSLLLLLLLASATEGGVVVISVDQIVHVEQPIEACDKPDCPAEGLLACVVDPLRFVEADSREEDPCLPCFPI